MTFRTGKAAFRCLVVLAIAAVALAPAQAQLDREGIFGAVTDQDGNPLAKVDLTLKAFDNEGIRPQKVKSSKKGKYIFPLIRTLEPSGWTLEPVLEGYRPYKFHILVRDGQKVLIQDDEGGFNNKPVTTAIRHRGVGYAEVDIIMVPEGWAPGAGQAAAPAADAPPGVPGIGTVPTAPDTAAAPTARDRAAEALAEGEIGEAITALEEALEESPDDTELRLALAQTMRFDGDDPGALRHLSKLSRLDPERQGVQLLMGDIQMDLGRSDQAMAAYAAERRLVGDDPELLQKLADAAAEAGAQDTVMEAYEAWVAADPENPRAFLALGTAQAQNGDYAASEETFRKAATNDPDGAMFFNIGVSILSRKPVTDEARRQAATAFRRCIDSNPKHRNAHFQLGRTLVQLGEIDDAKGHLKQYLDLGATGKDADLARELLKTL